jgi:preprotein translocase subunit SecG
MTAVLATLFFLTSLGLSYLFSKGGDAPASVMDRAPVQEAPADPTAIVPADPTASQGPPVQEPAAAPGSDSAAHATEPAPVPTNE